MFDRLPDSDTLYDALLARDAAFDGRAYVGVITTGIFCRLTCPARKPRPENCRFFDSVAACIGAGFRPCKRCTPLTPQAQADPVITRLLHALDDAPDRRWREADITAMGIDPSTARRAFRRQFGMTFLDMARQRRLARGFTTLAQGGRVIDAQMVAEFDSPSAFRAAFARLMGQAPGAFRAGALMRADWIATPLGPMVAVSDAHALHLLEFADRKALPAELKRLAMQNPGGIGIGASAPTDQVRAELDRFFAGEGARFDVPVALSGSPFAKQVWTELRHIPAGQTRSYGALAQAIGRPSATRAVARANGANVLALVVPCHRVLGADGALTGYGGGLWRKQRLIELERHYATEETPP